MKIEFIDEERTEAIITRGIFRKRQAHVKWAGIGVYEFGGTHYAWVFATTKRQVGLWTGLRLQMADSAIGRREEREARRGREWVPVNTLPPARVVDK